MQKITTFLWFNDNAEEAVQHYLSIFGKGSKVLSTSRYTEVGPGPKGSVMVVSFELRGQQFLALNGGPHFHFTEAISLVVNCEDQAEIDYFWEKLSEGGEKSQCGWVKDRYGLSWQVTPANIAELVGGPDPVKANRAMQAMLKMAKLDIAALKKAREG